MIQKNIHILPQNNILFNNILEFSFLLYKNNVNIKNSSIYHILSLFDFKIINIQKYILRLGEKYQGFITYKDIMYKWSIKQFADFIYTNYLNNTLLHNLPNILFQ